MDELRRQSLVQGLQRYLQRQKHEYIPLSRRMLAIGNEAGEGLVDGMRKGNGRMGKTVASLSRNLVTGEKIRYIGGCKFTGRLRSALTVDKEYEVIDGVGSVIYDDYGDYYNITTSNCGNFELVTEPQPDVHDLIANLGRRLHEVEKAQESGKDRPDFGYDVSYHTDKGMTFIAVTFDEEVCNKLALERTVKVMRRLLRQ